MPAASSNPYPFVRIVEQASSPLLAESGSQRLFMASSSNALYAIDHVGSIRLIGPSTGLTNPMTTTGDIIYSSDNSGTAARRGAGASNTVLTSLGAGIAPVYSSLSGQGIAFAPWLVDIIPAITDPSATTGTWGLLQVNDNVTYPFLNPAATSVQAVALYNSSNAQNDAISFDVVLSAGTWNAVIAARKSTNTAIYTLNLDGSSVGTVDSYAAAPAYAKLSITGWAVPTDGKHTIQFKAATRNGSNSTGWFLEVFGICLRRTA